MAFTAKDGSKHTNRDTMKRADARFGAQQPQKIGGQVSQDEDDGGMGMEDEQPQDGAAMAAEHGPAVEVNIQHDHEGGAHHVHARHPDGHEHHSEHANADEAHKFAAEASGVGGQGDEQQP